MQLDQMVSHPSPDKHFHNGADHFTVGGNRTTIGGSYGWSMDKVSALLSAGYTPDHQLRIVTATMMMTSIQNHR